MTDLTALKVSSFAGGGLLGSLLYPPISFLSNIGSYFFGLLLILLGGTLWALGLLYDISEKAIAAVEKSGRKAADPFLGAGRKAAQAACKYWSRAEEQMWSWGNRRNFRWQGHQMAVVLTRKTFMRNRGVWPSRASGLWSRRRDGRGRLGRRGRGGLHRQESLDLAARPSASLRLTSLNQSKKTRCRDNVRFWKKPLLVLASRLLSGLKSDLPSLSTRSKPAVGVQVNQFPIWADDLALALSC